MAKKQRPTRSRAIVIFCRGCMGYDGNRGGKVGIHYKKAGMMVKECEDLACPLWIYRNGLEEGKTRPRKPRKISVESSRRAPQGVETSTG